MGIGHKGMLLAARVLSVTAADLYRDPALLAAAKRELPRRQGPNFRYEALLGNREPPLDYRR